MLKAKNDDKRIIKEIGDLRVRNKGLLRLLLDLYHYIEDEFEKDTIVTMVYRTQEEQEQIYGKNTKKKSPHQFWHGCDIRSRIYSPEQITQIVNYLNDKYNDTNYYKWTAKCHEVNNHGEHFHIQYYKIK